MKANAVIRIGLGLALTAAVMMTGIGCSEDKNPVGGNGNQLKYDELTVALNTVSVKYDCDFDPVGVTQPGDFHYVLNVDTLSDDKNDWLPASSNKETSAKISNGGSKTVSGQSASFRFPRREGQAFRVRMTIREADTGGDDFKSNHNVTHIYAQAQTQMYAPDGTNYSSWDDATKVGKMSWNINKRDRKFVLGVLTVEGCNATMNYSVTVRPVS